MRFCLQIHGSQDFDICVKDMIPTDVPEHFRGTVSIWATVTSVDGSQQVAFDASTPVQRQLVDVRYSKDTRKQFKPGLSYVGKVSAGGTAPGGGPPEHAGSALPAPQLHSRTTVKPLRRHCGSTVGTPVKTGSFNYTV